MAACNQVPIDDIDWPVSMTSQDDRCPEGLWESVHYRGTGMTHPGVDAWERGNVFEFTEPEGSAAALAP